MDYKNGHNYLLYAEVPSPQSNMKKAHSKASSLAIQLWEILEGHRCSRLKLIGWKQSILIFERLLGGFWSFSCDVTRPRGQLRLLENDCNYGSPQSFQDVKMELVIKEVRTNDVHVKETPLIRKFGNNNDKKFGLEWKLWKARNDDLVRFEAVTVLNGWSVNGFSHLFLCFH